ncbi:MAG: tryptophan synthase subunit alpha [Candidatus Aminicenantes bacterium RBG_16_63_16]|nr:MAG: tryptophan synthase subunit alpha [Candidatus Aminicenantes bacterium RBG_16_63_16]
MSRFDDIFAALKQARRKGLVGYLTAGDPNFDESAADVREALAAGLDVLELGVPFSDPTADGPTIQAAGQRALAAGATVGRILDLARSVRAESAAPIVLFGYVNPFLAYGYDRLCADAKAAGVDGLLVVDLPFEETAELRVHADRHGLDLIPLIAPTTGPARSRRVLAGARGFVYYIMVKGVTGARQAVAADVAQHIAALRACTALPIAAGFGIGTPEQARAVASVADAVVVGSALVQAAREKRLGAFVSALRDALA